MKPLLLSFFLFILVLSLFTSKNEVKPVGQTKDQVATKASLAGVKDSLVLYSDNRFQTTE